LKPCDEFTVALGYLGELNPRGGELGPFQNFFDLVATFKKGGLTVVANADLNFYRLAGQDAQNFWGVSVAPAYAFTDMFGVGLRFEHLRDSANFLGMTTNRVATGSDDALPATKAALTTLTATLDIKPIPELAVLILRPEFRYEIASDYYYYNNDNKLAKSFWTVMLGAVVTSL
jgi:Putative beta-barrel porin-2, OmpL-like. bbp2